jgi:hypothetical protein
MKFRCFAVIVGLAVVVSAHESVVAEGIPFSPGTPFFFKFSDFTSIIGPGNELRSVAKMIGFSDTTLSNTIPVTPGEEVTGLIGDLVLDGVIRGGTRLTPGAAGPVVGGDVMTFKPGGRNPIIGDNLGSDRSANSGGFLELYNDFSPDFSAAGGPGAWFAPAGGHAAAGLDGTLGAGVHDSYPTGNEPSMWLQGVFESLTAYDTALGGLLGFTLAAGYAPTDVYALNVFASSAPGVITFGTTQFVLNITGGSVAGALMPSGAGPFNGGPFTPGFDMSGSTVVNRNWVPNGWQLLSNDPVGTYAAVPEPSSLAMCLSLLAAGGVYFLRKSGSKGCRR